VFRFVLRLAAIGGSAVLAATAFASAPLSVSAATHETHVYVNDNTAGANTIAAFTINGDGSLTPVPGSPFATGGAGKGALVGSQGSIQATADGRFVIAVDAGSNEV